MAPAPAKRRMQLRGRAGPCQTAPCALATTRFHPEIITGTSGRLRPSSTGYGAKQIPPTDLIPTSPRRSEMTARNVKELRRAPLETPTDLKSNAVKDIAATLTRALADMFALYVKTKNFHWHMSGRHFRDYHLLLDEQSEQIFATTDDIAER